MTIAKRALCLCLAVLCLFLLGCEAEPYPFEELLGETEEESPCYALVIPSENEAEYLLLAQKVAKGIAEKTGNQTEIYRDEDPLPTSEARITVAIGPTELPWVDRAYRTLRSRDYLCEWAQEGILLGGRTYEATEAAVNRFLSDLLPAATRTELIPKLGGLGGIGVYRVETLLLNGSSISDYRIEYDSAHAEDLLPMARELYERIKAISGVMLEVRGEEKENSVGKRIVLKQENPYGSSHMAYLSKEGDTVWLYGQESFGVSVALREFCRILLSEEEGDRWSRQIEGTVSIPYDAPTLTVGCFSMEGERSFSSFGEVNEMVALIRRKAPDMVLLGTLASGKITYLTDSMSEYRLPFAGSETVIAKNSSPSVTKESACVFRIGTEENGFLLCLLPDDAQGFETTLSEWREQSSLPMLVILHGKREKAEQKETALSSLSLVSSMAENYERNGTEYTLRCYATQGAFYVQNEGVSSQTGYGCLTVERLRVA